MTRNPVDSVSPSSYPRIISHPRKGSMKKFASLALIVAIALTGCASSKAETVTYTPPTSHVVKYEAFQTVTNEFTLKHLKSSDQRISVTLSTPTGIQQHDFTQHMINGNRESHASYTFSSGKAVSISVQNVGNAGSVTCRISVDGVVISENTSGSQYGIASCSGIAN